MSAVLWLLLLQGLLGAFDTLYYHEWRAKLPALGAGASAELKLHAARDFVYALLFLTLPLTACTGLWSAVVAVLLAAEVSFTLADFVVEDKVRIPLGGLFPGERITHALMGIVYGGMVARLLPALLAWWRSPTSLIFSPPTVPGLVRWALITMGVGVFLSGLRDLYAAFGLPLGNWPWQTPGAGRAGPLLQ